MERVIQRRAKSNNITYFCILHSPTKNCLIPSNVNSSRLTRIRIGSDMNLLVISKISCGKVAETSTT